MDASVPNPLAIFRDEMEQRGFHSGLLPSLMEYSGQSEREPMITSLWKESTAKIGQIRSELEKAQGGPSPETLVVKCLADLSEMVCVAASDSVGEDGGSKKEWKKALDEVTKQPDCSWTLSQEEEEFNKLKVRGCFPPKRHSLPEMDAFMHHREDIVQKHGSSLSFLNSLLLRNQSNIAVLSQAVATPDMSKDQILTSLNNAPGNTASPMTEAVSTYVSAQFHGIYMNKVDGEDAGNVFISNRAALACLMHVQVCMEALSQTSAFVPLWSGRQKIKLLDCVNESSRFQNQDHPANSDEGTGEAETWYHTLRLQGNEVEEDLSQSLPLDDLAQTLIAQYFDSVYTTLRTDLDARCRKMVLSSPTYLPCSMHLAPVFMHQDAKFQKRYAKHRPYEDWTKAFKPCVPLSPVGVFDLSRVSSRASSVDCSRDCSRAPSPGFVPSDSDPDEDSDNQYSQIPEQVKTLVRTVQGFESLMPDERAELIATLMDQLASPDHAVSLNSSKRVTSFELASANFVVQRHISAMVKNTTDAVNLTLGSVAHRFSNGPNISTNHVELQERFLSVLLGYDYPYLTAEQPRRMRYLSLDVVIPFLFRHRLALVHREDVEVDGTSLEIGIHKSRLFQAVQKMCKSRPESALAQINQLRDKWAAADLHEDSLADKKLVGALIDFLVKHRYSSRVADDVAELQTQLDDWERVCKQLVVLRQNKPGGSASGDGGLPLGGGGMPAYPPGAGGMSGHQIGGGGMPAYPPGGGGMPDLPPGGGMPARPPGGGEFQRLLNNGLPEKRIPEIVGAGLLRDHSGSGCLTDSAPSVGTNSVPRVVEKQVSISQRESTVIIEKEIAPPPAPVLLGTDDRRVQTEHDLKEERRKKREVREQTKEAERQAREQGTRDRIMMEQHKTSS